MLTTPLNPATPRITFARRAPYFGGPLATQAVKDTFMRGGDLREVLAKDSDPYVGELPPELESLFSGSQRQAFLEGLDTLASALREIFPAMAMFRSKGRQSDRWFKPLQVALGDRQGKVSAAEVRLLGPGEWGVAYRLEIGGRPYVFKVFYDSEHDDRSFGAYSDLAAGVHLTRNGVTRDMMKTFLGNPEGGWSLLEYLGPETARIVPPEARTLREAGFFFPFDQYSEDNYIDGVRIDSGGCYNDREEQYAHSGYYVDHYMGYLNPRAEEVQTVQDYRALIKEMETLEAQVRETKTKKFRLPGRRRDADELRAELAEAHTARWGIWSNLGQVGETEADRFAIFKECMREPFFRRHFAPEYRQAFEEEAYLQKALDLILAYPDSRRFLFAVNPAGDALDGAGTPLGQRIKTFVDCLGVRIGRGETDLLPEFFRTRYPQLAARVKV